MARPFSFLVVWAVSIVISSHVGYAKQIPASGNVSNKSVSVTYEELYEQFMNLTPDPAQVAVVENLRLQRDVGIFHLDKGTLYLCKPVQERVCAALFAGEGSFSYRPPTSIERQQLYRFYEKDSLDEKFSILFFIFGDTTLRELNQKLSFTQGKVPLDVEKQISYCMQYMGKSEGKNFRPEIMKTFLNQEQNDLFYAHFSLEKLLPLFFEINPYEFEEVRFMRRLKGDVLYTTEIINQFHRQQEYATQTDLSDEDKSDVDVESYKLDLSIKDINKAHNAGSVIINFHYLRDGLHWIRFRLNGKVDSVLWENGKKAVFFHKEKNPVLWVRCDTPSLAKANASLHLYGKLFYPIHGYRHKALFDFTFHCPSRFKLVSVGNNDSTTTNDDVTTSHWITQKPIGYADYYYDMSEELSIKKDSIPPITILMSEHHYGAIEEVGADVSNSVAFFQKILGRCPVDHLYAAEIGENMGLAFPGLVYLASPTFRSPTREGKEEIFRAHEVAHQWWGLSVDFKTYHDQWISEGFSDYFGLWYMQAAFGNNDKFFNTLREWKNNILSNRKFVFGSGQEAGPIWLGYRTSSSSTRGDYDLIIYQKGAWVLHMLRNMLLDLEILNEDKFKNMMKEFYQTHADKKASTEDFRIITEKYCGYKMDWFFKQWVYSTDIPTYKFAYKVNETSDKNYQVTCKIQQLGVPDDFMMFVPILVEFGKNKFVRLQTLVKGPLSEFELPLFPLKPEKIIFNNLESVLSEIEYVDWD